MNDVSPAHIPSFDVAIRVCKRRATLPYQKSPPILNDQHCPKKFTELQIEFSQKLYL